MRVIVYPHELIIGGSPLNAIDLAAAVADLGHEVMIYGVPGPLIDYIAEKGLRFVPAHPLKYRPAPTRILELAHLARRERIDLVHAYEWPPCLDAYYGAHLLKGVPVICSVLSMALVPLVPDSVPLIMGTRQLQESASVGRSGPVSLLEPSVDTDADNPRVDGAAYRRQLGITDGELLLVSVSRLSIDLKLDALVRAVDAVADVARRFPVRLVLVGTGDAESQLRRRAERINTTLGREVVTLVGPTLDPRPAYAAADVVLGMGSSALRAMAFAKPVVVQGEKGFSLVFGPDTFDSFGWQGFFGVGEGQAGNDLLTSQIAGLLGDQERRAEFGRFGRRTVEDHYSLHAAATRLLERYAATALVQRPSGRRLATEAARVAGRAAANEVRLHLPSDRRVRPDGQLRTSPLQQAQGRHERDSVVNAPDMTLRRADADESTRVECAVVIVTYNSGNHISDLLDTLLAAADDVTLRVIVVDNGSEDDTVQIVRNRRWVTCVETGRNLGYAGAINVGRRLARPCASMLVLNPDLNLEPGSVRHLFEALRDPEVGIAVPMILDEDNRRYPSLRREPSILRALGDALFGARMCRRPTWSSETVHDDRAYSHRHAVDWATGAVLLVADRCDELVGDWDDGRFFLYSEETDFARRARAVGFRIDYLPQARARHLGAGSGESHALVALMAVNRIRYFEKHHRRPASAAYRAAVILGELLRASDAGHRSALRSVVKRADWANLPQAELAG